MHNVKYALIKNISMLCYTSSYIQLNIAIVKCLNWGVFIKLIKSMAVMYHDAHFCMNAYFIHNYMNLLAC